MDAIMNRTFVLVGRMGYPHRDIKREILKRGGKVKPKVTATTDFLVRGIIHPYDKNAAKKKLQVEYAFNLQKGGQGIQIIWIHELFCMCEEADEEREKGKEFSK